MIKIPAKIEYVIDTLTKNGHDAYIVGGCVRDSLMGKTPNDFDITTSALPETVMGLFEKTVPTGIKHGTVTVIVEKTPIEVTTFRTESGYSDNRHPENVDFVSDIKEDLSRRDFTVNAIAYNHRDGIVDYFGGCKDIENRILRAVGNPETRFLEDALRILRLVRFASTLEFTPEKETFSAALMCAKNLETISSERIFTELYKASGGKNFSVISPLIEQGFLSFLKLENLPDFETIKKTDSSDLAFFTFLHFSSCDISRTLELLKVSNKFKNYCLGLEEILNAKSVKTKVELKRLLCNFEVDQIKDGLTLKSILNNTSCKDALNTLNEVLENSEPYLISHLAISGEDLKNKGFEGKEVGFCLKRLQQLVIEDPSLNTPVKLTEKLSEISP